MSKKFLLSKVFDEPLNFQEFREAKIRYCEFIQENKFSMPETDNLLEIINTIKRTPDVIGPYKDLTPFEALNRIGSDLVLLAGAEGLFQQKVSTIKPKKIHLMMGNKAGFDLEIHTAEEIIYGEAFNAAESFWKAKMRSSIHKLLDPKKKRHKKILESGKAVILCNKIEGLTYNNTKENEYLEAHNFIIHKLFCEYNEVVSFN